MRIHGNLLIDLMTPNAVTPKEIGLLTDCAKGDTDRIFQSVPSLREHCAKLITLKNFYTHNRKRYQHIACDDISMHVKCYILLWLGFIVTNTYKHSNSSGIVFCVNSIFANEIQLFLAVLETAGISENDFSKCHQQNVGGTFFI